MKLWAQMLWALLSGPGRRRGGIRGLAFSSWQSHPPLAELLSPTGLVSHWTRVFEKRGIPEARESSEYIVAHVLGAKTFQSLKPVLWTQPLTPQQLQCIQVLCSRRLQRVPVQYILGEWDFRGLSLKMLPPVFIPRPETEALTAWVSLPSWQVGTNADPGPSASQELVEWVLEEVAQRPNVVEAQGGPLILEVGCGSGAISLSLLSQLPQILAREEKASQVIAVDKEEAAINLTYENAQRLRLQDRIQIIPFDVTSVGSWTHLLPWGPMDLIVSNPPYIFHHNMEQLAPEIRSYEDPVALDGGEEGMDIITHILTLAPQFLKDSGSIFLEVEPRHPELVSNWLQSHPDLCLNLVAVRRDFCGRPRFLHVQRSGP
ncbi:MTRF1L release factor glutamine methyltransferase isoform X1 [Marmota monax]|uniref:MTRF1L release factor glutamine methyltransferase isoform X1 n=1 Tax=Marmota monax TaxID=9995 RepID=UPI001EAFC850|nr:MTRF1L release factor glutamine methyltransferase isoform X1 [Marmota monax]XP_046287510.1 MTRF1L release factor glutamine methyltransferase isoform X1 [Marmota monax]XP_046287511.1 MTRF1L release factor glutamine methyltransferase isoform X1 [Marmota monax]XP_046287512.1 MTRF1L release factor glutamine methyltransferase isoform X1 [Marmota monax]XP_046287513.1 MTRF1L release factor glutamine methyltransferase isoform X1 [Marmota monax]XP_046287514.1 MTRF1L release factor glutamine methyltr